MDFRDMSESTRIRVARSEIVQPELIFESASKIFAAFVGTGKVTDDNQINAMQKAVHMAIELAIQTEGALDPDSGRREHFR